MFREDLHGDVGPPKGVVFVFDQSAIHRAGETDKEFMLSLAEECYPDRDIRRGRQWMEWCMASPDRLVLVGANSMGVAEVSWRYGFERRARLGLLAARPGTGLEPLRMVRMMVAWAKEQGATGTFRIDADTGVDFGPFARRLGGRPVLGQYEVPI